jgi:hypothetical protein
MDAIILEVLAMNCILKFAQSPVVHLPTKTGNIVKNQIILKTLPSQIKYRALKCNKTRFLLVIRIYAIFYLAIPIDGLMPIKENKGKHVMSGNENKAETWKKDGSLSRNPHSTNKEKGWRDEFKKKAIKESEFLKDFVLESHARQGMETFHTKIINSFT